MPHSPVALIAIERAISRERLKRYLAAAGNDLAAAVSLYEQNIALSEAVFGLLHGLEVAIRNSMHEELSIRYGTPRWFDIAPLSTYTRDKVTAAIKDAGGAAASPGKVVAELSFGFWVNLAARSYHWPLWQPCLHRAFPAAHLARPLIHTRLEAIRILRNRIAHHEPVVTARITLYAGSGLLLPLNALVECAGWISPELATWLATSYRYDVAASILNQLAASRVVL